jgi:aromatic ring-opening dioxygenase LigB subunit
MKPPVDISKIQRFLDLTSYYRKFIKKYSKIAELLNAQLQKNTITKWGPECQKAFKELQKRLTTALILAYPNFQKLFNI